MKLNGLKDTPRVYDSDVDDAITYIRNIMQTRKVIPIDTNHFHEDIVKYLNKCIRGITVNPFYSSDFCSSSIHVSEKLADAEITIRTTRSNLRDVRLFLQYSLMTGSALKDLKGKSRGRNEPYEYKMVVNLHSDDYSYRGKKLISNGILRLVVLCHFLAEAEEKMK